MLQTSVTLFTGKNMNTDILHIKFINDQCSPSYRNQSINLHCKSMDWFLNTAQTAFPYSKSTMEILEQCVESVQSQK